MDEPPGQAEVIPGLDGKAVRAVDGDRCGNPYLMEGKRIENGFGENDLRRDPGGLEVQNAAQWARKIAVTVRLDSTTVQIRPLTRERVRDGNHDAAAQELTGTLKKIKESGTITLGHRDASIPFSYYDDKQQVVGYAMDICYRIVDAIKAELKLPKIDIKLNPITSATR